MNFKTTLTSVVIALLLCSCGQNTAGKSEIKGEEAVKKEVEMIDSLTTELDKATDEIEKTTKEVEDAVKELDNL